MNLANHPFRIVDETDVALVSGGRGTFDATTMAIGEEGGYSPTWFYGEDGDATTLALGEEGGGDYSTITSLAENGDGSVTEQMR